MSPRREPRYYRVTLLDPLGRPRRYSVQTMYGEYKAVAIATIVHEANDPDHHLYDVEVEDMGITCPPVGFSAAELYDDRHEW